MEVVIEQAARDHHELLVVLHLREVRQIPGIRPVLGDHFYDDSVEIGVVWSIGVRNVEIVVLFLFQIAVHRFPGVGVRSSDQVANQRHHISFGNLPIANRQSLKLSPLFRSEFLVFAYQIICLLLQAGEIIKCQHDRVASGWQGAFQPVGEPVRAVRRRTSCGRTGSEIGLAHGRSLAWLVRLQFSRCRMAYELSRFAPGLRAGLRKLDSPGPNPAFAVSGSPHMIETVRWSSFQQSHVSAFFKSSSLLAFERWCCAQL